MTLPMEPVEPSGKEEWAVYARKVRVAYNEAEAALAVAHNYLLSAADVLSPESAPDAGYETVMDAIEDRMGVAGG